jgi:hypothetical protein
MLRPMGADRVLNLPVQLQSDDTDAMSDFRVLERANDRAGCPWPRAGTAS